jgi:16S rRNA (guanine527-N7)-methyltransferase
MDSIAPVRSRRMFHVKHPPGDPEGIARKTRELLARALPEELSARTELLGRLERYAAILALWGPRTNLTAEPENPAAVAFHIADSLAPLFADPEAEALFVAGRRVADLGSGAGFPGVILAAACEAHFTLIEARRKRASFLRAAALAVGLDNVRIDESRGGRNGNYDVVVARAFARPSVFYEAAIKLLDASGAAVLWASEEQELELEVGEAAGLRLRDRVSYRILDPDSRREVRRVLIRFSR